MSALIEGNGSCLCGKIRIAVKGINRNVGACHCGTCRNWGGGPFMAVDCGTDVSFEGEENISVYSSSEWAERGFCKECGSHLFYRLKGVSAEGFRIIHNLAPRQETKTSIQMIKSWINKM